jgi:surface antigen
MTRAWTYAMIAATSAVLCGCNSVSSPPPNVASNPAPVAGSAAVVPETVDPTMLGGVLAGSVGLGLENGDRIAAYRAQVAALESGERKSWRGERGVYGFVEAAPSQSSCRSFTQTVYVAGRPYVGRGSACRQADGIWTATGA